MARDPHNLSRRERQIMEVIYRQGQAAVSEVLAGLDDPPSYSTIRTLMGVLARKGHLRYQRKGMRYVYSPVRPRQTAARSVLRRTVKTFFDGQIDKAVAALIDMGAVDMTDAQLDQLAELIRRAKAKESDGAPD